MHFQNAVGATVHWLDHNYLVSGNQFFGRFLLRLSLTKPSQVKNLAPQHLILVMILFYLYIFLGHPVYVDVMISILNGMLSHALRSIHSRQYFRHNIYVVPSFTWVLPLHIPLFCHNRVDDNHHDLPKVSIFCLLHVIILQSRPHTSQKSSAPPAALLYFLLG